MTGEAIMVGMAEVRVSRAPGGVLMALGLGSCVGVCAYDPLARAAGLAHVVLPDSLGHDGAAGKFADTAIPLLLEELAKLGGVPARLRVALAGGAQLFAFAGAGPRLEIGARNAGAVLEALARRRVVVAASDVGGTAGRTVTLTTEGIVRVKTIGLGERDLTDLGGGLILPRRAASPVSPGGAPLSRRPVPGREALRGGE